MLISKGNIIVKQYNLKVVGYVEFWKVNAEQLKRILNKEPFDIGKEDIGSGDICHIHNIWIDGDYRGNGVIRGFKEQLERLHFDYYSGTEYKNNKRVRMWRRHNEWRKN
jgi:hypothetical protein